MFFKKQYNITKCSWWTMTDSEVEVFFPGMDNVIWCNRQTFDKTGLMSESINILSNGVYNWTLR